MYEYEAHNAEKETWMLTHNNHKNNNQAMCQFATSYKNMPLLVMLCCP